MTDGAGADDREALAAVVVAAAAASRSLATLLHRESVLVAAGHYDALAGLTGEKQALLASLVRLTSRLQAAGPDAVLALANAGTLMESLGRLKEAAQVDTRVLRAMMIAADRIAHAIGRALADGSCGGYGRGGQATAPSSAGIGMNDRV